MNLSIRELNELIYSLGITAHHGMFCQKDLNKSLLEKLYGELNNKLSEEEDDANYFTIPSKEDIKRSDDSVLQNFIAALQQDEERYRNSHIVSNEEADEDAGYKPKGVTQSILDYVEFKGEATYTEMQNFYRITFGSNSFSHILISLVVPYKNRPTRRYLYKTASGKYVVRVAGLHNWVVNEY